MNRFGGETLLPDEVAQNTYDNAYGFGNWTFAMGTAGSYGYKAYLDFTTIEGLKREIAKGYPVGVSVKYTNDPEDDRYPYIEGSTRGGNTRSSHSCKGGFHNYRWCGVYYSK